MSHSNVAIFVPHNGCPHMCSFCNQKEITGQCYQPTQKDVVNSIQIAINTLGDKTKNAEIAFFGGSFTAIDQDYMVSLLSWAYPYVKSGQFYGIRVSTRPDCITEEILTILKSYGVTAIELGAQSMDDTVLTANNRGHTAKDVVNACKLIKKYDISLGLQMMTGLYKSTAEKDIYTAKQIISLQPKTVRIYPTITMKNTELANLYMAGKYIPMTLEQSVNLCATLIQMFADNNITLIRLGLHYSESLVRDSVAGEYHPAFKELCESKIYLSNIQQYITKNGIQKGCITIQVNPRGISKAIGQKKSNIKFLCNLGYNARVTENKNITEYSVIINN